MSDPDIETRENEGGAEPPRGDGRRPRPLPTVEEIGRRSDFSGRWFDLLYRIASGIHFHVHYAANDRRTGERQLRDAYHAAWDLFELERGEAASVGSRYFGVLVGRLSPELAAVRRAALGFAATPSAATRRGLLDAVREMLPAASGRIEMHGSPFVDDVEERAWADRRLPREDGDAPAGKERKCL